MPAAWPVSSWAASVGPLSVRAGAEPEGSDFFAIELLLCQPAAEQSGFRPLAAAWGKRCRVAGDPPLGCALAAHVAEQVARHLAHLDLLGAFGDAVAAVVAVDVLERLVARVADAAVHLHRAVGRLADQAI